MVSNSKVKIQNGFVFQSIARSEHLLHAVISHICGNDTSVLFALPSHELPFQLCTSISSLAASRGHRDCPKPTALCFAGSHPTDAKPFLRAHSSPSVFQTALLFPRCLQGPAAAEGSLGTFIAV